MQRTLYDWIELDQYEGETEPHHKPHDGISLMVDQQQLCRQFADSLQREGHEIDQQRKGGDTEDQTGENPDGENGGNAQLRIQNKFS